MHYRWAEWWWVKALPHSLKHIHFMGKYAMDRSNAVIHRPCIHHYAPYTHIYRESRSIKSRYYCEFYQYGYYSNIIILIIISLYPRRQCRPALDYEIPFMHTHSCILFSPIELLHSSVFWCFLFRRYVSSGAFERLNVHRICCTWHWDWTSIWAASIISTVRAKPSQAKSWHSRLDAFMCNQRK